MTDYDYPPRRPQGPPPIRTQPSVPDPRYQQHRLQYEQQQYQQPPQRHAYAPGPYGPPPTRRKRRVFLWVFLAIQLLFILWIVVGIATVHTGPTHAQLVSGCYNHNWFPLFKSQADCVKHYGGALNDAGTAGKAIGVGLIIAVWFVVDVILGISYGVYKLATRNR